MKKILVLIVLSLLSTQVFAKKECTKEAKEKWMSKVDMSNKLSKEGYTFPEIETTGSCYEIYGKNKAGECVEVYFNPVDGSVFKSKIKKCK